MTPHFCILAHSDAPMLARLADRLRPFPTSIHIDAKADIEQFRDRLPGDARLLKIRHSVSWGGRSVVRAMEELASAAMPSMEDDDHLVFLSGQCYPVRPISDFATYLSSQARSQFCRAYRLPQNGWERRRVARRHWFDAGQPWARLGVPMPVRRVTRKAVSLIPLGPRGSQAADVFVGSQWMALTKLCWTDIHRDGAASDMPLFRQSFAPDEMAIQTLVHQNERWSKATQRGGPESLPDPPPIHPVPSLGNFHVLHPRMRDLFRTPDDLPQLESHHHFVRKVHSTLSQPLLDHLDRKVAQ
ncbi:beta-1,6-N-acetylglucosaminyltransferase [Modestobacter sp. SYSU DS0290]